MKKVIEVIVSAVLVFGVFASVMGEEFIYPSYEMTQSIEFAQSLGHG